MCRETTEWPGLTFHISVGQETPDTSQMEAVYPSMVSHSAGPHTELLSSMASHRVEDHHLDQEDEYDEEEEDTAVTYSFTLEDNRPVVIQAVAREEITTKLGIEEEEEDDNDKLHDDPEVVEEEEEEIEVEPVESKLVINFPAGNTITVNNMEIGSEMKEIKTEDKVLQDIEEETEEISPDSVQTEYKEKTGRSKIFDFLFSCFRFRCTEKCKKNKNK